MTISSIMIVEDSEAEQFLCKVVIEEFDAGIEVFQAYDGQQGLDMLEALEAVPDVILLDINMPGMNGYEFLDVYEANRQSDSTVIVMLTSSNQQKDKEKSMIYDSVKKYIQKPLNAVVLQEIAALISSQ